VSYLLQTTCIELMQPYFIKYDIKASMLNLLHTNCTSLA